MESDNLNPGDHPSPKKPSKSSQNVSESSNKQPKRRKRGKGKRFTHYKSGSKGGRPRTSNECISGDDASNSEGEQQAKHPTVPATNVSLASTVPLDERLLEECELPPIATSSPLSTPRKVGDVPGPSTFIQSSVLEDSIHEAGTKVEVGGDLPISSNLLKSLDIAADTETCSTSEHREDLALGPNPGLISDESRNPLQASTSFDVSPKLVQDVTAELGRRIHMPFIILPEEKGINVLLLSRHKERSVQRRAFFSFDATEEEISVHTRPLPLAIQQEILQSDDKNVALSESTMELFLGRIVTVVKRLRSYEVCVGVDDPEYKPLWELEKDAFVDNNPYKEARYTVTLRSSACHLLVPTQRYTKRCCTSCIHTRVRFKANLPHHLSSQSAPNTPNVHLDRSQLIEKVKKQQKELSYARKQIAAMKEKLKTKIEGEGVDVDEDMNNDLCSLLDNANLSNIQALFFEQQLKAVSVKDARRRRWHPTLIRFALLLKTTSTAAYRAIQDSGVIVLPSEKTLYEYAYETEPEGGCTVGKLDRVCKQILEKYPEAYQTYHVLMMDEIHINKKLVYLKSTGEMIGYVSLSDAANELNLLEAELKGEETNDCPVMATKVQTYMVKGVATAVSQVVGSFPTSDAFDAEDLYDLTWQVISALEKSGLRVIAISSDGCAVNRAFYNLHVPLTKSSKVIFDTINLCAPERPLYFFSDVPHLLKTIRNGLYRSGSGPKYTKLLTINGEVMVWQTIRKLYEEDRGNTLRRCFKLNANNVFLNSYSIMKVNLAAQVMSETVALDLETRGWPGISETVKFIRRVNNFFDMLNGASSNQGTRKANPNLDSYENCNDERFDKLLDFVKYLNDWEEQVQKKTNFRTAERNKMLLSKPTREGIEITVHSFIGATKFLFTEGVKFINARVFCQDPLERYFGKQRQSGGGNRNPTAAQFFRNELKIAIHRDMNVRMGNVMSENRGMDVSDEPLPKRQRTK